MVHHIGKRVLIALTLNVRKQYILELQQGRYHCISSLLAGKGLGLDMGLDHGPLIIKLLHCIARLEPKIENQKPSKIDI